MKMVKCDRCGKLDDGKNVRLFDDSVTYHTATIEKHTEWTERETITPVDLCRECWVNFNELLKKFMEAV